MNYMNPNQLFNLGSERLSELHEFSEILSNGQLFRYRDDHCVSSSDQLEKTLAVSLGHDSSVLVSNGTTGLQFALRTVGVRAGDKVGVSAFSFIACSMAILNLEAIPVPLDVGSDLNDLCVGETDFSSLAAVIVVHVQGHAVTAEAMIKLCRSLDVPIVEDICQGYGALDADGNVAGSRGRVAVASFQQSKQLSSGEGGAVIGNEEDIERVRSWSDLGAVRSDDGYPDWDTASAVIGTNGRLSELQAALVLDQVRGVNLSILKQRSNRSRLWTRLDGSIVNVSSEMRGRDSGSHTLLLAKTDRQASSFCAGLAKYSVFARVVWPRPFPEFGVFRGVVELRPFEGTYPTALEVAPRLISVPTSKYLGGTEIESIAQAVNRFSHCLTMKGL